METIGSMLIYQRRLKGLSQSELRRLSGISKSYLSEIERDVHSNITTCILCDLCRALGITPNDLIPKEYYKQKEDNK